MGRKAQLRRAEEAAMTDQERQAVLERRRARTAETRRITRKSIITITATIVVFSLGQFVNDHLPAVIERLKH